MATTLQNNSSITRPPVVAIMGHVDHGKSKLLDFIRRTNIVEKEAGGITQHIAAYEVELDHAGQKRKITFLDTPGHAAFEAIRTRGVKIADIAVLIVSAEDGPKAQTLEAIKQIKEGNIPFIVAINKIDLPGANIEKTKYDLAEHEVYLEGMGGNVPFVEISAKQGTNVHDLLDMILLVADMEDFKGEKEKPAEGYIIEAHLDNKKGISASLVIKNGSLKKGQFVVAGNSFAPVRAIEDFMGKMTDSAQFSNPIRINGWSSVPPIGVEFSSYDSKTEAEKAAGQNADHSFTKSAHNYDQERKTIPLIIKADVSGTIEAIEHQIDKIKKERISLKIISTGTGNISEADIKIAGGDKEAIVLGFNVKVDPSAAATAERNNITIYTSNIIYKLSEWLEEEIIKRTPKITVDEVKGRAKILKIFSKTKDKQVVGGKVLEGSIKIKSQVNILRRDEIIGHGKILELQKFKSKVEEVETDSEFGSLIESKIEIVTGDVIESVVSVTK